MANENPIIISPDSKAIIAIGADPTGLYGYGAKDKERDLRTAMTQYIIDNGITDVYTNLSLGAEQLIAEAAINAKVRGLADVKVHALLPYPNQDAKWPDDVKKNFQTILSYADETVMLADDFKQSSTKRMSAFRDLINQGANLFVIDNGDKPKNTGDKKYETAMSKYTTKWNQITQLGRAALGRKTNTPSDIREAIDFMIPATLEVTQERPYGNRPANLYVSKEKMEAMKRRNADRDNSGVYNAAERKEQTEIYKLIMDELVLLDQHRQELMSVKRGFSAERLEHDRYLSLPQTPAEADALIARLIPKAQAKGLHLENCPMISVDGDGSGFSIQSSPNSHNCWARDEETGDIYGSQYANRTPGAKSKYTWAAGNPNDLYGINLSPGQPASYYKSEHPRTVMVNGKECEVICLTEGTLKCGLAQFASGDQMNIVGMAGVFGERGLHPYNDPETGRRLFEGKVVVVCFDADMKTNKNVQCAFHRIQNNLIDVYGAAATVGMKWADEGKGIDDYLVECNDEIKTAEFQMFSVLTPDCPVDKNAMNEYGKPEPRRVPMTFEESPIKDLNMDIDMAAVRAAGYGVSRLEPPVYQTSGAKSNAPSAPVKQETEEERRLRKDIEHKFERSGRQDKTVLKALPIPTITNDTQYEQNASKFVVAVTPENSAMLDNLRRGVDAIVWDVGEKYGLSDEENKKAQIIVSDAVMRGDKKEAVILFKGFSNSTNGKTKDEVAQDICDSIKETFVGNMEFISKPGVRSVLSTEWDYAAEHYDTTQRVTMLDDPRKTKTGEPEKLKTSLDASNTIEDDPSKKGPGGLGE